MNLRRLGLALISLGLLCLSCADLALQPLQPASLDFFVPAPGDDPWNQKVRNWQVRHELDDTQAAAAGQNELAREYHEFSRELRRRTAADAAAWMQQRSRAYYRPDVEGDHWATLAEVIDRGGDDCDGLDLMTFQLLRRLGFGVNEIFRAIIVERGTGQHHMVTLWFEDGDRTSDPFVLDPTGVVTPRMARLSELRGWDAIELFDERAHFRVEATRAPAPVAGH
jgi:hypothetical protein